MPAQPARRIRVAEHRLRPPPRQARHCRMPAQHRRVGGGLPPPQPQRLRIQPARRRRVSRCRGRPGPPRQLRERCRVELAGPGAQPVARRALFQQPVAASRVQDPAQPADMRLHQLRRGSRRLLSPQRVDDRLAAHQLAGLHRQQPGHRSLARRPQPHGQPVPPRRQRPQHRQPQPAAMPRRRPAGHRPGGLPGGCQRGRLPGVQAERTGQRVQRPRRGRLLRPCSRSRTAATLSPDRSASCRCVSPAARRCSRTKAPSRAPAALCTPPIATIPSRFRASPPPSHPRTAPIAADRPQYRARRRKPVLRPYAQPASVPA